LKSLSLNFSKLESISLTISKFEGMRQNFYIFTSLIESSKKKLFLLVLDDCTIFSASEMSGLSGNEL